MIEHLAPEELETNVSDPTLPPHDLRAEESVIGAVLKNPMAIAAVTNLPPSDFYGLKYRAIWQAMLDLWHRNVAIDYATVSNRLSASDMAKAHVSLGDLVEIDLGVPSAAYIEHYARIVQDTATQRRYVSAAQKIAEKAWLAGVDVQDLAQQAETLITAARPSSNGRDLLDPERWADAFWDDLSGRIEGHRTAVGTGLIDIDEMTLGLEAGGLYLLMGTPGTGKTELAMQISMHVAKKHGPVVFASLEMTEIELAQRFARIAFGMDRNKLAKGTLDEAERQRVLEVLEAMRKLRFWPASPRGRYTTADLRADANQVRAKDGHVALIVADYVQRFRDRQSSTSSREENIGLVAENLKSLAREFTCPVLAPVQPNREYVARASKRPVLSDLRESGKLEQEADVVLGLYRDEKHDTETRQRGIAEVHMLKNRSGVGDAEGMRRIVWRGTRYDNFTKQPGSLPWNHGEED